MELNNISDSIIDKGSDQTADRVVTERRMLEAPQWSVRRPPRPCQGGPQPTHQNDVSLFEPRLLRLRNIFVLIATCRRAAGGNLASLGLFFITFPVGRPSNWPHY